MKRGFLTLIVTLVAGTLLAPGKAQAFPLFDLSEIWPADSVDVGTAVDFVESFVPGTSIPITVTTSQPIFRTPGGQLSWPCCTTVGFTNNWTITIGAPSKDVEITLVDFDRHTNPSGVFGLETLSQLDAVLGAPTTLVTTGADGNAQMVYQPNVVGGRILHSSDVGSSNAGTAVATWEDVNLSTITFTTTRNTTALGQNINVRLGEVEQVVPEPSTWLLLGMGLTGLAYWRKRAA